ncbi:MAG: hypothetical protein UX30_C0003G0015 [Candidatus Saccharibacteria bacterium GW2011_GWA2_46_10]|nr:MAG: hypothetical protein UX30_C0003G0015 [Candidatus Saccharibacteria bacterium GW2011_GWA2_46_10]
MNQNISPLHQRAETLREQGDFDGALIAYEKEINAKPNSIEPLLGRVLTYKHLYLLHHDQKYIDLSLLDINQSLNISKKQDKYKIYFALAETDMLLKIYSNAVSNFQKAFNTYPFNDSQKGRYLEHLGEAQYLNGDRETGLLNLKSGLEKIRQYRDVTDSFLIHVWETGCLMKLAYFLRDKNYLSEAERIIQNDSRLIIRKRQLEEIRKFK